MGVVKLSTAGIVNYEKYSNLRAGIPVPATGSFDLLETQVLASAAASVTFSSLGDYAAEYQHLQLRMAVRSTRSDANNDQINLELNGVTGANYSRHELTGDGSSLTSSAATTASGSAMMRFREIETAQGTANVFNAIVCDILDPFNSSKNTTIRALNGTASRSRIMLISGAWYNTASLTQITLRPIASIAQNSRISLYGLKVSA